MPVAFDTSGMEQYDERTWFCPRTGDQVSLTYIDLVPDLPAPLDDVPLLRHRLALETAEVGALIEAHIVTIDSVPTLLQLLKLPIPDRESGQAFIAAFTVPKATCSVVLRIQCAEGETTGLRESAVIAQVGPEAFVRPHPYAPALEGRLPWHVGDEERWDGRFPDHPLSRARAWAHRTISTGRVDPAFAELAPFRPSGPGPNDHTDVHAPVERPALPPARQEPKANGTRTDSDSLDVPDLVAPAFSDGAARADSRPTRDTGSDAPPPRRSKLDSASAWQLPPVDPEPSPTPPAEPAAETIGARALRTRSASPPRPPTPDDPTYRISHRDDGPSRSESPRSAGSRMVSGPSRDPNGFPDSSPDSESGLSGRSPRARSAPSGSTGHDAFPRSGPDSAGSSERSNGRPAAPPFPDTSPNAANAYPTAFPGTAPDPPGSMGDSGTGRPGPFPGNPQDATVAHAQAYADTSPDATDVYPTSFPGADSSGPGNPFPGSPGAYPGTSPGSGNGHPPSGRPNAYPGTRPDSPGPRPGSYPDTGNGHPSAYPGTTPDSRPGTYPDTGNGHPGAFPGATPEPTNARPAAVHPPDGFPGAASDPARPGGFPAASPEPTSARPPFPGASPNPAGRFSPAGFPGSAPNDPPRLPAADLSPVGEIRPANGRPNGAPGHPPPATTGSMPHPNGAKPPNGIGAAGDASIGPRPGDALRAIGPATGAGSNGFPGAPHTGAANPAGAAPAGAFPGYSPASRIVAPGGFPGPGAAVPATNLDNTRPVPASPTLPAGARPMASPGGFPPASAEPIGLPRAAGLPPAPVGAAGPRPGEPPGRPEELLQTVLIGLPIGEYLPLWHSDSVSYWRVANPTGIRARLGVGLESRTEIDNRRFREAALFAPDSNTLFLTDRYRNESGNLGGASTRLIPAGETEAYRAADDKAMSDFYGWLGDIVLAAGQRGEYVAVETGGWNVPVTPVVLIMLRTDGREWHSVVETSPVPHGAPVWRDQQPVDGDTQLLASPATDRTIRAAGLLTRFAVATWPMHPFQLGLSFGPNPTLGG